MVLDREWGLSKTGSDCVLKNERSNSSRQAVFGLQNIGGCVPEGRGRADAQPVCLRPGTCRQQVISPPMLPTPRHHRKSTGNTQRRYRDARRIQNL